MSDDLRERVQAVRDHYASPTSFPPGALVPVDAVVTRLERALLAPAPASETASCDDCGVLVAHHGGEMDDCPERCHAEVLTHQCRLAEGHAGMHRDGPHGWTPAPTPPTTVQADDVACRCTMLRGATLAEPSEWEQADDCPEHPITPRQACVCGHTHIDPAVSNVAGCYFCDCDLDGKAPVTGQADRDAGQVRLTEKDLKHLRWLVDHDKPPSFGAPVVRSLLDALAARQSDPDATERVEWGVRWANGDTLAELGEQSARRRVGLDLGQRTLVRRTVTTGEWTEVGE